MDSCRSANTLIPLWERMNKRQSSMLVLIVFLYIFLAALYQSISHPFSYDEDQFFAGAFMVAQCGLLPYQDFPFFHMPNLVYGYAPLFPLFHSPFLVARLLAGFCGVAIAALVFFLSRTLFSHAGKSAGLAVGLSAAVLVTNSPSFALATGYVWNHTHSTLCALIAFALHCRAMKSPRPWKCFLLSGLFLGMAIGIRLTFAPLIVPFLAMLFLFPKSGIKRKISALVAFAAGGMVSNAPGLYFLITDPSHFWFGNIVYAGLNTLYRMETEFKTAMTLGLKLTFLGKEIFSRPGELLILLVLCFPFLGTPIRQLPRSIAAHPDFLMLCSLLPFLYCGSLAPTPAWPIYFFAPIPFLVLLATFALAYLRDGEAHRVCVRLFVLAALVSCFHGNFPKTPSAMHILHQPESWAPAQVHAAATALRSAIPPQDRGKSIVSLTPSYAAEAGIPIHPSFVVGVFAWRVSPLMPPAERRPQMLVSPADMESLFADDLPGLVISDHESITDLQSPLREFAIKHKYRLKMLPNKMEVWLPPSQREIWSDGVPGMSGTFHKNARDSSRPGRTGPNTPF